MLESFQLDTAGVREVLKSQELRTVVDTLAGQIADNVRASVREGTTVSVHGYTTDRGAASITVEDVRAMAWQARDGILTRAAGAVGLEVKAWQT
jgi:acyl-CoA hydrolase